MNTTSILYIYSFALEVVLKYTPMFGALIDFSNYWAILRKT